MRKQRTIKEPVRASGIGLHTGKKVEIELRPAKENNGVVFYRADKGVYIEARPENVVDTTLATTIGKEGVVIKTVEHLLATLYGLHIDNVLITVWGDEVPIMDGSSAPWVYLIKTAGIKEQSAYKKEIIVKKPIKIKEDGKFAALIPSKNFEIHYSIHFDNSFIGKQKIGLKINELTFIKDISKARTFGFVKDIEFLQAHNLALGGSLDNAIVVDEYGIVNEDPLRYQDEFVRHKVLDAVGDLSVLGYDIKGKYFAYKSGHDLNRKLLATLVSNKENYEVVGNPYREKVVSSFIWSAIEENS